MFRLLERYIVQELTQSGATQKQIRAAGGNRPACG
jgi:hypothetical protein